MAAKTTVRVAVTNNAAKDDSFSGGTLDWLSESGSLSGSLNVLGNDPGSASLYAVHSTMPSGTGQMAREATGSTDSFSVVIDGQSYNGTLTLNADGTVGFDLSSLKGQNGQPGPIDRLAEGEVLTVTFYYTAKMANGVLSTAKVTVEITGENDAPVATAETISAIEDGAVVTGEVDATDVDHGAVLTYALAGDAPAGFSFNSDGTYSFDAESYDHLPAGVEDTFSVDYTVTDEHGASSTATISFTVTGVNDPAVIGGEAVGSVAEDNADNTASGQLTIDDADDGENLFDDGSYSGTYGTLVLGEDGFWTYSLDNDNGDVDALDDGDTLIDTITVQSVDGTTQDISITINGNTNAVAGPILAPVQLYDPANQDPNNFDNLGAATGNSSQNLDAASNTFYGGTGNDTVNGQNGNDTIFGGSGDDQLNGNNDLDRLFGGDGSDVLRGSNNPDILIGGYGADTLSGGNGGDIFRFLDARDRGDTITDFDRSQNDKIDVDALNFTGGFNASATANGLWQVGNQIFGDLDGNTNTIEFHLTIDPAAATQVLQSSDFIL